MKIFKTAILFGATATIFLAATAKQMAVAVTLNLGWDYIAILNHYQEYDPIICNT